MDEGEGRNVNTGLMAESQASPEGKTEAQKGEGSCSRSHNWFLPDPVSSQFLRRPCQGPSELLLGAGCDILDSVEAVVAGF